MIKVPWNQSLILAIFLSQRYTPKNALSSFEEAIFQHPPLLKAFFKNIKANEGIRIDKCNYSF